MDKMWQRLPAKVVHISRLSRDRGYPRASRIYLTARVLSPRLLAKRGEWNDLGVLCIHTGFDMALKKNITS